MTVEVRPASSLDLERLAGLFNEAYSDYFVPISLDPPTLVLISELWDIDLDASRVAGEEAFALLGVRGDRGWIGGMGVVPAARRRGHGEAVMRRVIEEARARGLREVSLEVLVQNEPARRLYEKLGFEFVRELEIWELGAVAGGDAQEISLDEALAEIRSRRTSHEPWQRADATVDHLRSHDPPPIGLAVDGGAAIVRLSGDHSSILQLAADDPRPLLAAVTPLIWLNVPAEDPASRALSELGARVSEHQLELVLPLD